MVKPRYVNFNLLIFVFYHHDNTLIKFIWNQNVRTSQECLPYVHKRSLLSYHRNVHNNSVCAWHFVLNRCSNLWGCSTVRLWGPDREGAVLQETRHPASVPPRVSGLVGGAVPGEGGADSRPLHLPQTPVSIAQQVHVTHCDHTNWSCCVSGNISGVHSVWLFQFYEVFMLSPEISEQILYSVSGDI